MIMIESFLSNAVSFKKFVTSIFGVKLFILFPLSVQRKAQFKKNKPL